MSIEEFTVKLNRSLDVDEFNDDWQDVFIDVTIAMGCTNVDYNRISVEGAKEHCLACLYMSDAMIHSGKYYQQNRQYLQDNIDSKFWISLPHIAFGVMLKRTNRIYYPPISRSGPFSRNYDYSVRSYPSGKIRC